MDLSDKIQSKEIDGKKISVTPFFGLTALTNKNKILKMLGPGLAGLFKLDMPKNLESFDLNNLDLGFIGAAIGNLAEKTEPDVLSNFILDLLKDTRIDGVPIDKNTFNIEFMANLTFMYKILWFVLEVNYGDFFEGGVIGWIKKKIATLKAKAQTPEKSKEQLTISTQS